MVAEVAAPITKVQVWFLVLVDLEVEMEVVQEVKMEMEELETGPVVVAVVDQFQELEVMVDLVVAVAVVVQIPGEETLAHQVMAAFMEGMEDKDAAAEAQEVAEEQVLEVGYLITQEILALQIAPSLLMKH